MKSLELEQLSNIRNTNGLCLDLIFTNLNNYHVTRPSTMVKEDVYHPALIIAVKSLKLSSDDVNFQTGNANSVRYNYKKKNKTTLYVEIGNIEWKELYNIRDPELTCDFL